MESVRIEIKMDEPKNQNNLESCSLADADSAFQNYPITRKQLLIPLVMEMPYYYTE